MVFTITRKNHNDKLIEGLLINNDHDTAAGTYFSLYVDLASLMSAAALLLSKGTANFVITVHNIFCQYPIVKELFSANCV